MGREFVARKSSVWGKKSDTKPSLFASRPFSVQTREQNTVNKKELPKEIPPANYITDKMGLNASQPTVQRQEDNSDKGQEPDLISKSDASPIRDEEEKEETISPKLEDKNNEEKVNLKPAADERDEQTVSPQLEDENKQEDLDNQSIQTKLTVGEPGDKYEQEADTVATKVVEQINSPKSQQPVQGKVEPVVQPTLMRQGGAGKGTVNRDVEQNIQQARGGGQGLADNVRQPMEQAFGADFSGVKVHTGGQADVLNRSLNSRAFATGQDIFFKQGEYNPGSKQGQELLAHELTHVVQQTGVGRQIQCEGGNIASDTKLRGELEQIWHKKGKGAFFERLRHLNKAQCNDKELSRFVESLQGDDSWLAKNILLHGSESNWPIHLKVEREMKGWKSSGGKVVVFDILRAASGTELSNDHLDTSIKKVFGDGTDDLWLAQKIMEYGPEPRWPQEVLNERHQLATEHQWQAKSIVNWAEVNITSRMGYVMRRLVNHYRYPVNGAAGIVGNLRSESGVLPNRIEGSAIDTPMIAPNFSHKNTNFTAEQVMNRNRRNQEGPRLPGIGLAQWTSQNRRAGLFQHQFQGQHLGSNILFSMNAQVDYLVNELRTNYRRVNQVITRDNITVNDAADEIVYNFEVPGSIIDNRQKLPRKAPEVQRVFERRRANAQEALEAFRSDSDRGLPEYVQE
jgi:hypothetical protein